VSSPFYNIPVHELTIPSAGAAAPSDAAPSGAESASAAPSASGAPAGSASASHSGSHSGSSRPTGSSSGSANLPEPTDDGAASGLKVAFPVVAAAALAALAL
jgi:hypothetical protein